MNRRDFAKLAGRAVVAWPLAAAAQQKPAVPVIGFLHPGSPARNAELAAAFRQGLAESGYVEGRNLAVEYCWGEDHYDRLPALAAHLARRHVAVIVVTSTAGGTAARNATATIPIVFNFSGDPVELGLVASLDRPGGNITGTTFLSAQLAPKQLELLHTMLPEASTVAVLIDPTHATFADMILKTLTSAAAARGLELMTAPASSERELDGAFKRLKQSRPDGVLIAPNTFLGTRYEEVAALTLRYALPAIYQFRGFAAAGGLMSYGTIHTDPYRDVGIYAGKILDGAKPADMPVKQPTRFELVINLKTARTLGIDVPRALLVRADEVIE